MLMAQIITLIYFNETQICLLLYSLMHIGLLILMILSMQLHTVFLQATTQFLGPLRNKILWHDQALNLNIELLSHVASEISLLKELLSKLAKFNCSKPILQYDNLIAGALATNPMFHARTKHIEIHVHFVCDQVLRDVLEVQYIPSTDQLVDNLNKPFTHSHFQCLRSKLGIIQLLSHLRGNIREKCHISNTHSSSPSPKSI